MLEKEPRMILQINRCNIKGIDSYTSTKNNVTYNTMVLAVGVNDLRIKCGDYDFDELPTMVPVKIQAAVVVDRFGAIQFGEVPPVIELI